jgi:Cdc6-like AAA superfamily ATPase
MSYGAGRNALIESLRQHKYKITRLGNPDWDHELFFIDLSEWKLCFSDRTPLIWIKAEAAASSAQILIDQLGQIAKEHGWRHRECLVLVDADGRELKQLTVHSQQPVFVVIDLADQQQISSARAPSSVLNGVIGEQVPIATLAPYQYGGAVEGTKFFGRSWEIDRLMRSEGNFAITGIRRIGKTSLLKEVRRLSEACLDQDEDTSVAWVDCNKVKDGDALTRDIIGQLDPHELYKIETRPRSLPGLADFVRRRSAKLHRRLILFLDEIDASLDSPEGRAQLSMLHSAADEGRCRVLVAGLNALEAELQNYKSPFYKFFERVVLRPFDKDEATAMIVPPMIRLGVTFESQAEVVEAVRRHSGGQPILVQFFCIELVKDMQKNGHRTANPALIEEIAAGEQAKMEFINAFRDSATAEDKLVVYAVVLAGHRGADTFTLEDISRALRRHSCEWNIDRIDRCCDRLCEAGFWVRGDASFQFGTPVLPRRLHAAYPLERMLAEARKEIPS